MQTKKVHERNWLPSTERRAGEMCTAIRRLFDLFCRARHIPAYRGRCLYERNCFRPGVPIWTMMQEFLPGKRSAKRRGRFADPAEPHGLSRLVCSVFFQRYAFPAALCLL